MSFSRLTRTGWQARVNAGAWSASAACLDGNLTTYTTMNSVNDTLDIDMGSAQAFDGVELYSPPRGDYTPRVLEVYVSTDATNWGSAIATLNVAFPDNYKTTQLFSLGSQNCRYVRFKNKGSWRPGWGGDYYPDTSALRMYEIYPGVGGASVSYVTQAVEEIALGGDSKARITQAVEEVLLATPGSAVVTQAVVEVIVSIPPKYEKSRRFIITNSQ